MTKETAVALPALMILGLLATFGHDLAAAYRAVFVSGALVAVYTAWRTSTDVDVSAFPPLSMYLAKELLSRPFAALAMPFHHHVVSALPIVVALQVGALPVLIALRQIPPLSRPIHASVLVVTTFWVLAGIAPVFTFLSVGPDLQGSRYLYLSAAGWAVFVATYLSDQDQPRWLRYVLSMAAVLWLVVGVAAVRLHLRPWGEAARVRDRIIRAIEARSSHCATVDLDNWVDNVNGAYLFRNGLEAALAGRNIRVRVLPPGSPPVDAACRVPPP